MKLISNIEHGLTLLQDAFCLTVVHRRRREQAQAGMPMLFVVPAKESLTESTAGMAEDSSTNRFARGCWWLRRMRSNGWTRPNGYGDSIFFRSPFLDREGKAWSTTETRRWVPGKILAYEP